MKKLVLFLTACFLLLSCKNSKKYATGLIEDKEAYNKIPLKAQLVARDYSYLPESVNLKHYTPVPESQGPFGTCVAWATTYAAMTACESIMEGRNSQYDSSAYAFSPYYLFRYCNPDDYEGNGMTLAAAVETLHTHGVPRRSQDEKYILFNKFDIGMYNDSELYRIGNYTALFNDFFPYYDETYTEESLKIQIIKKSISEKKPVVISFIDYGTRSFSSAGADWYANAPSSGGAHAMVIVGYDDNHRNPADRGYGAFLFQNSWGTDWGEGGYFRLLRGRGTCGINRYTLILGGKDLPCIDNEKTKNNNENEMKSQKDNIKAKIKELLDVKNVEINFTLKLSDYYENMEE